eukprot:jgi/Mesvir1/10919/Mv11461-RA.1
MDGKLRDMKEPYVYGYPPKLDTDFRGSELAKGILKDFRSKTTVTRTEALPIHIARRHFSDKDKEEKETIQDVSAPSAPDVLLPVRRGCMAQFVDGKYEDPSKKERQEARVGRSVSYRDYSHRMPIEHAYPGKAGREGMDFRIPVRRTCDTEKNAKSGHVREVWKEGSDKIVECGRKQASEYRARDEVEVRLMGRDDWVEAVVVSAPPPAPCTTLGSACPSPAIRT